MSLHLITSDEAMILKQVVKEFRNKRKNNPTTNTFQQIHYAPEVYIAYPPSGGIPPLERAADTGTSVPGTAAGDYDRPGSAECDIYRIIKDANDIPELLPVTDVSRTVYNLTTTRISQDWISIKRDKWGSWLADTGGSGTTVCPAQNAIIDIAIAGSPTGGTFDLYVVVNSTEETLTFNYDDTSTEVATEFATHSQIGFGNVSVSYGPFPDAVIRVEFVGSLAETDIPLPVPDYSGLTGGSTKLVVPWYAQRGFAA